MYISVLIWPSLQEVSPKKRSQIRVLLFAPAGVGKAVTRCVIWARINSRKGEFDSVKSY